MALPLLVALIVAQGPSAHQTVLRSVQSNAKQAAATQSTTQAPAQKSDAGAAAQPYTIPFTVVEPVRLALTPKIDGTIDEEEWDALSSSSDMKSYFQWEPGKLHFAAQVPSGHDLVASFDLKGNGWLIGKDNLEVRLSNANSKVTMTCRVVDNTSISGPKWIDLPGMTMASFASVITNGATTTYEASISDPGIGLLPTEAGTKLMLRLDDPESTDAPSPAYLPRVLTPVSLAIQRSAALPNGLWFNTEGAGHAAIPGESIKLRLTYNGNNSMKLQRLEMHSEGFSKNDTNQMTVPFPKFDEKGRSYVDYSTSIAESTTIGYRILKGTLSTADNIPAVMESSYRIGPLVDFEVPRQALAVAPLDRSVRFSFYAKSNSSRSVKGEVSISVPDPLKILNGADRKINIQGNRGKDRQTFDLFFPPNISGTFPVKFSAILNGKKIEQVQYITVGGL